MKRPSNPLQVVWHCRELDAHDDRPRRAVEALEAVLPWAELRHELSDRGRVVPLSDRDAALLAAARCGELPLLCNRDETRAVTLKGTTAPRGRCLPAMLRVSAWLPREPEVEARAEDVLSQVGIALGAWWGVASPMRTAAHIARQIVLDGPATARLPSLPPLKDPNQLASPLIPHFLGWINYWSRETAQRLAFPDPLRHQRWLERARRSEHGAWTLSLTSAPLDLDVPHHLETLQRAYADLPEVGGREATADPSSAPRNA
jgi:hypothetical protein